MYVVEGDNRGDARALAGVVAEAVFGKGEAELISWTRLMLGGRCECSTVERAKELGFGVIVSLLLCVDGPWLMSFRSGKTDIGEMFG